MMGGCPVKRKGVTNKSKQRNKRPKLEATAQPSRTSTECDSILKKSKQNKRPKLEATAQPSRTSTECDSILKKSKQNKRPKLEATAQPSRTSTECDSIRKKSKQRNKRPKLEATAQPSHTSTECDSNWKKLQSELQKTVPNTSKRYAKGTKQKATAQKQKPPQIWFDGVSQEEILLANGLPQKSESSTEAAQNLVKKNAFEGMTRAIGIDCEMVGTGKRGCRSALARVSIVNQYGKRIYDKHVRVDEAITDYRTWVSGIRPSDLKGAEEFTIVQREVAEILKDRVLVGHALHNDLKALYLSHPKRLIRDTSVYPPFRLHNDGKTPSLKMLSAKLLGVKVQGGEHSSVQDAQAAMKLYMMHKRQWEKDLKSGKVSQAT